MGLFQCPLGNQGNILGLQFLDEGRDGHVAVHGLDLLNETEGQLLVAIRRDPDAAGSGQPGQFLLRGLTAGLQDIG